MYKFPRVATVKYHKLGVLEQQKCIFSQFGGQESEIKVLAGPCSL